MAESSAPAPATADSTADSPLPCLIRRPRRTLREAAQAHRWKGPLALLLVVMTGSALLRSASTGGGLDASALGHSALRLAYGLVGYVVGMSLLPYVFGRAFGSQATLMQVFTVGLWSSLPAILVRLPLDGAGLALHGAPWWAMNGSLFSPLKLLALPPSAAALEVVDELVGFWVLGLSIVGWSEVGRISALRVLLAMVLPLFVLGLVAAIAAAVLVASMASPS